MSKCKQFYALWLVIAIGPVGIAAEMSAPPPPPPGVFYTNMVVDEVPWSIQVVTIARDKNGYELQSYHAGAGALGLETLSTQVAAVGANGAEPVAAINGGFYLRDFSKTNAYEGCPRGLQIEEGEVLTAPSSNACLWVDYAGQPHLANVASHFQVSWPDGRTTPFQLNGPRAADEVAVYTPAVGRSTHTRGGRELILEPSGDGPWLPLRMERDYSARVREVRTGGDALLASNSLVLSLGPALAEKFPGLSTGAQVRISTRSVPALPNARNALCGGPVLLYNGRPQKVRVAPDAAYELSSMLERHPRTAFGWNDQSFFLVQVDGRQKDLSLGMTVAELSGYLLKLGCTEAINLDGGGSSCLWFAGKIRNHPCDGSERSVANSLIVLAKKPRAGSLSPAVAPAALPAERSAVNGN